MGKLPPPPTTGILLTHFSDLPVEVKLRIFSFFKPSELNILIAPVCRSWKTLSRDPSLWKVLSIFDQYCYNVNSESNNRAILKNCKQLRVLQVIGIWQEFPAEIAAGSKSFQLLKELHLKTVRIDPNTFPPLVSNCRQLQVISLESSYIMMDLSIMLSQVGDFPKLQSFSFMRPHTSPLQDAGVKVLTTKLQGTLREIKLQCDRVTDAGFTSFEDCHGLEVLHLTRAVNITDASLKALSHLKLKCFKLNIPFCLEDGGSSPHLTTEGLRTFLAASERRTLEELGLQNVDIDTVCIENITKRCKYLQELSIRFCPQLHDGDVIHLLPAYASSLRVLDLSGCEDLSANVLMEIPQRLLALDRLELSYLTVVDDSFRTMMSALLPNHRIDRFGDDCFWELRKEKTVKSQSWLEFFKRSYL